MIDLNGTSMTQMRRRCRAAVWALVVGMSCVAGVTTAAFADDGDVDPTYGVNGSVILDIGMTDNKIVDTVIQPDDKIVVADPFRLGRFNVDGTLDATFGNGGLVSAPQMTFSAVALQQDGKIIAAGHRFPDGGVVRYHANGSLDQSFGTGGVATFSTGPMTQARVLALVVQPDGKLVATGTSFDEVAFTSFIFVARLEQNGLPDASFQGGVVVSPNVNTLFVNVRDVALQADGRIVVAGALETGYLLIQYFGDGSQANLIQNNTPDQAGFFESAEDIVVQSDGKLLVAVLAASNKFAVVRYDSNLSLDTGFGSGGFATPVPGSARAIGLQPDGRILVGGLTVFPMGQDFQLLRLHADGDVDTTFGNGGVAIKDFPTGLDFNDVTLSVQTNGRIVLAGGLIQISQLPPFTDWVLTRFEGPPAHAVKFFLNGDDGSASQATPSLAALPVGHRMTLSEPATQTLTVLLPDGVTWTSDVSLTGQLDAQNRFRLHLPCTASLSAVSNLTIEVSAISASGASVQPLARLTQAQKIACTGPVTFDIPVIATQPSPLSKQRVRLGLRGSSVASPDVDLELGAEAFLEVTRFFGIP